MKGFSFKKDDLVKVDHVFSAAATTCMGQCGTVTAVHDLPRLNVRLESGEDKVLHEQDLTLIERLRTGLVEMTRTPPPPMSEDDMKALVHTTCA